MSLSIEFSKINHINTSKKKLFKHNRGKDEMFEIN